MSMAWQVRVGLGAWSFSLAPPQIGFRHRPALPVIGEVPEFSVREKNGLEVTREPFRGRIWVADFIFTRCAGTCPEMTRKMGVIQSSLAAMPELYPPVLLASFTVDPEWDTPEVLEAYSERFGAQEERWLFLRGPFEDIQKLANEGFRLGLEPEGGSEAEPIIHSQSFVLVDPRGRIRGYFDGTQPEGVHKLLAEIQRLSRER